MKPHLGDRAIVGLEILVGLEMLLEATEKVKLIRLRMKSAQDRQKSNVDRRHKKLECEVGHKV